MAGHALRVARDEAGGQRFALHAGQPVLANHARIDALLRRHLSAQLASLFARAVATPDGRFLEWYTDFAGQPVPLGELTGRTRTAAEELLQERLGAVRALAGHLAGRGEGDSAELLRLICGTPPATRVYVVNGQPVITGWGGEGTAPAVLPVESEGDGGGPAPRVRWVWLALLAAVVLLLAVLLGLRYCTVPRGVSGSLAVNELARLKDEEAALRRELEVLEQTLAGRRAACPEPGGDPTPEPQPPAPPEPAEPKSPPEPKNPAPAKKAELPAERWRKGDLSMLEGCWVLGRDAATVLGETDSGKVVRGVDRAGRICLDRSGRGRREKLSEYPGYPPTSCSAPVTAWFEGETLRTRQPAVDCKPVTQWLAEPNWLTCRRVDDSTALCRDGIGAEHEFRREGAP